MNEKSKSLLNALSLSSEERYDLFVEQVFDQGELWSLHGNGGWVLLSVGEDSSIPFWPSAELAEAMALNEWKECTPKQIDLEYWKENWVPGMIEDKVLVSVFPNLGDSGTIDHPEDLLAVFDAM